VSAADWAVLLGCALLGFALVSWLLALIRQQRAPPLPIGSLPPPAPPLPATPGDSVTEQVSRADISRSWHMILGVAERASAEEIESAFQARLAECERVAFDSIPGTDERRAAETRRERIRAAYDFIRRQAG